DAVHLRHARADRRAEDDEIERCRDDGRDQALPDRADRPRHFEAVDRPDAVEIHGALRCSWTRLTKMSSSELWRVRRSLKPMPRSRMRDSSEGMPVRSAMPS